MHRLMGHIGVKGLARAVTGIETTNPSDDAHSRCEICARANIKRLPFPKISHTRSDVPGYRIHIDICGPLPIGYGKVRYFMNCTDDASRWMDPHFLRERTDTLSEFIIFQKSFERSTGNKVVVLRIDNGTELVKGQFRRYCEEHGITYEKIVPDASPQNGVAERSNWTLLSMARAMLLDSGQEEFFWPLAVQAAAHLRNRSPTSALPPHITPFQIWKGAPPDLSHIRLFGSRVVSRKTDSDSLPKLQPRGEQGIFMGYARDAKGYLIWVPDAKCIRVRRDIVFLDNQPPIAPSATLSPLWEDLLGDLERRFCEKNASPTQGVSPNATVPEERIDVDERTTESVAPSPRTRKLPARLTEDNAEYSSEGGLRVRVNRGNITLSHNGRTLGDEIILDDPSNLTAASLAELCAPQANALQPVDDHIIIEDCTCQDDIGPQANTMQPIIDPDATDPLTIREAQQTEYANYWNAAIHEELGALKAKSVYEVVKSVPAGRKAVGSKWVFHIKRNSDGHMVRFKVRLVAKGFTQIPGQDFNHTFAPVAHWDAIRTVLAIAASQDLYLRHIDIKTAFLNGPLNEEIYMKQPEILGPGYWKLKKGLYGLKQAGRSWYLEFNEKYQTLGFTRCETDWSVHVRDRDGMKAMSTTSVDDILLATTTESESDSITADLGKIFEITDNHEVDLLLGCKVLRNRSRRSLILSQEHYTADILRTFKMDTCNAASTPLPPKLILTTEHSPKTDAEKNEMKNVP